MMRALLLAVLATAFAPALAEAKRSTCPKPAKLSFSRPIGRTVGVLRWKASAPVRVLRNGRIVGQTTRRALRVPVKLGRTYRFSVVPLSTPRCAATKRVRVAYRAPGAPSRLTVRIGDGGLQFSWRRGRRGDGRLAGYQLRRDGTTLGQTRATTWQLAAFRGRHSFTVVAVDRRGRQSRPSNAVTAAPDQAPTTPQGVQALPVSESQIGLAWQPSEVGVGRIAGYRVLRDGVVVKQVQGTSHVLDNLVPSTDYSVQVVAVDGLGRASAPSAPVVARTQDPLPTNGHAHAYLLATTDHSFADFRAHYRQIAVVYPTYYDCTSSRLDLAGRDDPLVTQWARARKVLVMPRVNCQGTTKVHRLLTEPALRQRWLDQLVALAAQHDYDGLSIDFEAGPAEDREAMSTFVEELAARLHADGRRLTVAASGKARETFTHPRSGIFDYDRLSRAADWVFVMAWGLHWSTSAPGPQDDATWVRGIADYVATMPLKQRFVYGTNLYAMDWPNGGGPANEATAYQYGDIVPRLPQLGAAIALDPAADNYHATYTDAAGVPHDVWYPDAETTARRMRLARERGIGAIGFWRLGFEDQRLWEDPLLAPGAAW
ncbi:MAG TPA: glycosyl hydrolase family 18 protein [Conexibacter sp.]|nr:glycosyl hydrolase family 18 protein [Conexibacter sp.]